MEYDDEVTSTASSDMSDQAAFNDFMTRLDKYKKYIMPIANAISILIIVVIIVIISRKDMQPFVFVPMSSLMTMNSPTKHQPRLKSRNYIVAES